MRSTLLAFLVCGLCGACAAPPRLIEVRVIERELAKDEPAQADKRYYFEYELSPPLAPDLTLETARVGKPAASDDWTVIYTISPADKARLAETIRQRGTVYLLWHDRVFANFAETAHLSQSENQFGHWCNGRADAQQLLASLPVRLR